MRNKINELLLQLEEEIQESPKPRLGNSNKRIINIESVMDLVGDIKVSIPEEIRLANALLNEKESILERSRKEAAEMLAKARRECERLISKQNIITKTKERAEGIILRAESNADIIAQGARNYADGILIDLNHYLSEYIEIIDKNRQELNSAYTLSKEDKEKSKEEPQGQEDEGAEDSEIQLDEELDNEQINDKPEKNEIIEDEIIENDLKAKPEKDLFSPFNKFTKKKKEEFIQQVEAEAPQDVPDISFYKRNYDENDGERLLNRAKAKIDAEPNKEPANKKKQDNIYFVDDKGNIKTSEEKEQAQHQESLDKLEDDIDINDEELFDMPMNDVFKELFGDDEE